MADSVEDLEPLFDYHRVRPIMIIEDDDDKLSVPHPKKKRISERSSEPFVDVVDSDGDEVREISKDEEDWLLPPPKNSGDSSKQLGEDPIIKELRLKKQELKALASKDYMLQILEESAQTRLSNSVQGSLEAVTEQPLKPHCERAKIVISIQDKNECKQFRVYKDDKLERLFKTYADKVKLGIQNLVFLFDGEKIDLNATPDTLGMDDDDIIEVHVKKS